MYPPALLAFNPVFYPVTGFYCFHKLGWSCNNLINEAIPLRFFAGHEIVPFRVMRNLLDRLPSVLGHDFIEALADLEDFASMDIYFRRLSLKSTQRLVDHHPSIGQSEPLAFCSGGQ